MNAEVFMYLDFVYPISFQDWIFQHRQIAPLRPFYQKPRKISETQSPDFLSTIWIYPTPSSLCHPYLRG